MKLKKQANVAFFSKLCPEDGKFTITSVDRRVNGALKNVFEVTVETGNVIDTLPRLKDAKSKIRGDLKEVFKMKTHIPSL